MILMSWLLSLLVALLAGAIALACMLLVTSGLVDWYHIPSREGASGYFVLLWSLFAGLLGGIIGLIVARKVGGGFGSQLLWAAGINVLLCAVVAVVGWLFGDHSPDAEVNHPAPATSVVDYEAAKAAKLQAEFDAVLPDAPIPAWFPYTGDGGNPHHRAAALRNIQSNPGHIAELASLMTAEDRQTVVEALKIVQLLPKPVAPELKAGVAVCGRRIAQLIRQVNDAPAAEDPSFERAADVSVFFNAWIATARLLREPEHAGSAQDFVPELLEILTLSRVRPEIHVMRQDVLRVASHYAEKWAGIAPLPGDPPAR